MTLSERYLASPTNSLMRECIYGECAHEQHERRTLTLTHTIITYSISGHVVRVHICATRQTPCRKRVYPAHSRLPTRNTRLVRNWRFNQQLRTSARTYYKTKATYLSLTYTSYRPTDTWLAYITHSATSCTVTIDPSRLRPPAAISAILVPSKHLVSV